MEIDSIVIEREDGPLFCGILFYEHAAASQYLPWTVDLENPDKIVLKLFPPDAEDNLTVVQQHYETMAGAIVQQVMQRQH